MTDGSPPPVVGVTSMGPPVKTVSPAASTIDKVSRKVSPGVRIRTVNSRFTESCPGVMLSTVSRATVKSAVRSNTKRIDTMSMIPAAALPNTGATANRAS